LYGYIGHSSHFGANEEEKHIFVECEDKKLYLKLYAVFN